MSLKIISDNPSSSGSCSISASSAIELNLQNPTRGKDFAGKVSLVTLGCAKNQVDSEVMLGVLRKAGYDIVTDVTEADIAIVNTCGFLESAIQEGIDVVLGIAENKETGRLRRLIVAGCMVERFKGDIRAALPEVDEFVSTNDIMRIADVAGGGSLAELLKTGGRPYFLYDDSLPRILSTRQHFAYVKISEGCNRPCTFCIIPKIRGAMRSRKFDSVLREVESLGEQGVREINLVAQDLTSYGSDLVEGKRIEDLLEALNNQAAVDWIRILYAYPVGVNERLLKNLSALPKICEYLDIPLQHSSNSVLKDMKRPLGRLSPRELVPWIKSVSTDVHIRTTFITGFPGETDADVKDLENFISEGHFTSVGVFKYSPEEGTPSFSMAGQISEKEKAERLERLMLAQAAVNKKRFDGYVGQTFEVLLEGAHEDAQDFYAGRTRFQAPEVDGSVIINNVAENVQSGELKAGVLTRVEVTEVAGYDLVGVVREII